MTIRAIETKYEKLFEYMYKDHNVMLLTSDMDEIVGIVKEIIGNEEDSGEPYFGWCDVEGCENEGCSGGFAWRETGYWTVCSKHADEYRKGKSQPKMKQNAIDKENSRDKVTGWLPSPNS